MLYYHNNLTGTLNLCELMAKYNAKRIVFSDDGYIYYTEDHYESFEQLYP